MGRRKEYLNPEPIEFKGLAIRKEDRIVRNHKNTGVIYFPKYLVNQKFDIILIPKNSEKSENINENATETNKTN